MSFMSFCWLDKDMDMYNEVHDQVYESVEDLVMYHVIRLHDTTSIRQPSIGKPSISQPSVGQPQ